MKPKALEELSKLGISQKRNGERLQSMLLDVSILFIIYTFLFNFMTYLYIFNSIYKLFFLNYRKIQIQRTEHGKIYVMNMG